MQKKDTKKVLIFGTGKLGQTTLNALTSDNLNFKIIGIIDENESMQNKFLSGYPIYSVKKAIKEIIPKNNVSEIIFATEKSELKYKRKRKITDQFLKLHLLVKEVPPVESWINGQLRENAIHLIKIEDLLGRNSIQLDWNKIENGLKNSVVLVTGAAGSIGSEIVRQLIDFGVKKVILLDKAESDLYNLQQELIASGTTVNFEIIIADVTNKSSIRNIFIKHWPTIIFNAAAYKHVPLMEDFPHEALRVNVGGIVNMAELSLEFGVEKFVMISTDKAVNPTNVMGTTKRISEIFVQSLAQANMGTTQFITTRFGNVLGSNGSVVPLFKKQIEKGGPVTITHKDITRYFMTIPEACQLVLEAGFIGKGGEIFVFDMGEPIKIYDLAKKMISLSGYVPGEDIQIKEIGLRPGEKLYEELLGRSEVLTKTHNDKIMIGKTETFHFHVIHKKVKRLLENLDELDFTELYSKMKDIVPEYTSSNSKYKTDINGKNVFETRKINGTQKNRKKVLHINRLKQAQQKHQLNFF
ncbi:nucleoside-diphosphate sugar epimerase/dehydratase [Prolixibacteraceae bacterium Z1-6]|uniref:Nucleoside-diphosphate sugar epimerase/dehydratase n=1 Tax=Draconibacterium aestuarii TaxID=2998507 RepID=A0A9X3FHG9_9BACT|nr:nucleoside-diphosphate sugar epimerase/dehydratase [Prolixibacteraceae bacterium Z1-6]